MLAKTYHISRTGEEIVPQFTHEEAVGLLEELSPDSWIFGYLHKFVNEAGSVRLARRALKSLGAMFLFAAGRGLKAPKINAVLDRRRYTLYLSKRGTICLKVGYYNDATEKFAGRDFLGWITPESVRNDGDATDQDFYDRLLEAPVAFLAEASKAANACCYCGKELTTEESRLAGYGKTCASNWGLPWGNDHAESFTDLYTRNSELRSLMDAVAEKPYDEEGWMVLSDWLAEHGVPAKKKSEWVVTAPAVTTVLPRSL